MNKGKPKASKDVIQISKNVSRFIEHGQLWFLLVFWTWRLWSYGLDYRDNQVVVFKGSLEIHSDIEGENEALLSSFDYYEASLMDEDHLWYE